MKKLIALMGCMLALSGCTQSNIVSPTGAQAAEPNFEIIEGVVLDRNQIADDLVDYMNSSDMYECGKSAEAMADEKDENITINLVVADGTSAKEAAGFAEYMVKSYADAVSTQDFSYSISTDTTYGSYFDTRNVRVTVAPESTKDDTTTWIVDQTIAAGTNEHVKALEK